MSMIPHRAFGSLTSDQQEAACASVELRSHAAKGLHMTDVEYAFYLAMVIRLQASIRSPYGFEYRKPRSPRGAPEHIGYLTEVRRAYRGRDEHTSVGPIRVCVRELETPPASSSSEAVIVVSQNWFAHTTVPKRMRAHYPGELPLVCCERAMFDDALFEALRTLIGDRAADVALGIRRVWSLDSERATQAPLEPKMPDPTRAKVKLLQGPLDSVTARLGNLLRDHSGFLGHHEADVVERAFPKRVPSDPADLADWIARSLHLLELATSHAAAARAEDAQRETERLLEQQREVEQQTLAEAERVRQQNDREDRRRRLMQVALGVFGAVEDRRLRSHDLGPGMEAQLRALRAAIPGTEVEGKTTEEIIAAFQAACDIAQAVWTSFLGVLDLRRRVRECAIPAKEVDSDVQAALSRPDEVLRSDPTEDFPERLRQAIGAAEDAWNRFLLLRLERMHGGPRKKK